MARDRSFGKDGAQTVTSDHGGHSSWRVTTTCWLCTLFPIDGWNCLGKKLCIFLAPCKSTTVQTKSIR